MSLPRAEVLVMFFAQMWAHSPVMLVLVAVVSLFVGWKVSKQ